MHENLRTETIKGDNAPAATGAIKRPYQSPTVFKLAHSLTKSGAAGDPTEDTKYGPSGKY